MILPDVNVFIYAFRTEVTCSIRSAGIVGKMVSI